MFVCRIVPHYKLPTIFLTIYKCFLFLSFLLHSLLYFPLSPLSFRPDINRRLTKCSHADLRESSRWQTVWRSASMLFSTLIPSTDSLLAQFNCTAVWSTIMSIAKDFLCVTTLMWTKLRPKGDWWIMNERVSMYFGQQFGLLRVYWGNKNIQKLNLKSSCTRV